MTTDKKYWKKRSFWEDFAERLVGTFSQSLLGALPVAYLAGIDWVNALYVALFASLLFILKGFSAGVSNAYTGASFGTTIPREDVRTIVNSQSPTNISTDEGSDLSQGTAVHREEPYSN